MSVRSDQIVRLEELLNASPLLGPVLQRSSSVNLPGSFLAAGAIAQTVWNDLFGFPAAHGIADIDLIYFDDSDLSETTEAFHADRVRSVLGDTGVHIDVKNEARVHVWYEARFGYPIEPYRSTEAAIDTFPTTATAIGVALNPRRFEFYAPFGLDDIFTGTVRANKSQITREIYEAKISRWLPLWPGLCVIPWDGERHVEGQRNFE